MNLRNVKPGDIVIVEDDGVRSFVEVMGKEPGALEVRPLTGGERERRPVGAADVLGLWRKSARGSTTEARRT
jgi:hypothetical protein